MAALPEPTSDEEAVTALDAYVARLQAGDRPDKATLLKAHPELAAALDCLDALEQLAPAKTAVPAAPDDDASATLHDDAPARPARAAGPVRELGKFELLVELGRGGMGVVYKARQKDLGRIVALKMILGSQLQSQDVIHRFHDEARAAAAVSHPNITAVYEAGELLGQPYMAIQYIDGPSLAGRLRQGPLLPESAARTVAAVARAVEHLHSRGFIHRDLKPSNILLDTQGQPYVTDFGLVKMLGGDSHKTTTGAILGTPSYMAPEQASGHTAEVGPRSDIYSLGAILYECLTGRPPFLEATPLDTLVQVMEGEPPRPRELNPHLPRDLEAICLRCLEKTPERRYATAAAVADNLEHFLNDEPVEGLTAGLWPRLMRWARREPSLVSRLVTLAAIVVLIQVNYHAAGNVELWLHAVIMGLLLLWGGASFVFQKLLNTGRWQEDLPFAWAGADMLLWTVLLLVDNEAPQSPLLIGYACLIAASGLWFRARLVWFVTIMSLVSYSIVLAVYVMDDGEIHGPHRQLIFVVGLLVIGSVVSYQVNRVRALGRYYERRPLPR
jgi:tRNA A-37 threonylcarbamoyl transferase component Bud32